MKRFLGVLMALLLVSLTVCASLADELPPQPEAGKKYEGWWGVRGGTIEIYYEEEGYRVLTELLNNADGSGVIWEYSCYYVENTDSLVSVSSAKRTYTMNMETMERTEEKVDYLGVDGEGQESVFKIGENGALTWKNGREPNGEEEIEFRFIGKFQGTWRSAEGEEPVWVEFNWKGLMEETYNYEVYLHRGDDTTYSEFIMTGEYDENTGKLTCIGRSVDESDPETYDAFFSMMEDGRLLYEAANGIVMEYDLLGGSQG